MDFSDNIRRDYIGRINKVMDYVENNLDKELSLELISGIACFSPFHFHRIFSALTGETLNSFIFRKRIENVASLLLKGYDIPIAELAFKYGFNSASSFSRAFKKYYGMSPTEFKACGKVQFSKIDQVDSKDGKQVLTFGKYICSIENILKWLKMSAKIEVKEMPELKLAYMTHVSEFDQIGKVYDRLMKWAGPKDLLSDPGLKTVTVYHDDPKVTHISKVRQSACITLSKEIKTDGEVGCMSVPAGKYAVGRFELTEKEFEKAWDGMCVWVTEHGYKSKNRDYYELYHMDPKHHPEQKFVLDICIPVE